MISSELADSRARSTIPYQTHGGIRMQRDMEVVRKVLRAVQQKGDLVPRPMSVDGVADQVVAHHIALLLRAGYIDGVSGSVVADGSESVLVRDLTWEGHEFAGALLAEDTVWSQIKETVGAERLGTMPLKLVQEIATKALSAWVTRKLGL